jgi:hypothetical protein
VDDRLWPHLLDEPEHTLSIADIEFVMSETPQRLREPALVPPGVARGSEEDRPLVIIDTMDVPSESVEVRRHFAANQPRRSSNQYFLLRHTY